MNRLIADKSLLVAAVRRKPVEWLHHCPVEEVEDLELNTDLSEALIGIRPEVHSAGRVYVMKDQYANSLAEFRRVNVAGTLNLAYQAAASGLKRFVFVTSIKVNGEQTQKR